MVATIGPEIPVAVAAVEHMDQMPGIGLAGVADLHGADQLVQTIHADRQLVAEIRFSVLLRPACLDILLPALGRRPLDRHGPLLHHGLLIGRVVLDRCANDAGIDDLPLASPEAVVLQLELDLGKDPMLDIGFDQALAKEPDRIAIRNPAGVLQPGKALEAQAIEQLELHLLVGQVEQLLKNQQTRHHLRRIGRSTAFGAGGPRRPAVDLDGQGSEVHMLVEQGQRVAETVELGFSFLVGKQTEHGRGAGGGRVFRVYRTEGSF